MNSMNKNVDQYAPGRNFFPYSPAIQTAAIRSSNFVTKNLSHVKNVSHVYMGISLVNIGEEDLAG